MDLSRYSTEQLQALLSQLQGQQQAKQSENLRAAREQAQQAQMGEMPWWEKALAGTGKAFLDIGQGVGQLTPWGASEQEVDARKALDAPLMDTGWGMAGNVAGNVAAALPVAFIPGVNTLAGGIAAGAATGFAQPVGTEDSRTLNTAIGGVLGGVAPAAVATYKTGRALMDPFTKGGQERIVARTLEQFASDPAKLMAMNPKQFVPGSAPTLAQATLDPGLATLERSVMNQPGVMQEAITSRLAQQNAARQSALTALGGTEADIAALTAARDKAAGAALAPLRASTAEIDTSRTVSLIDRMMKGEAGARPEVAEKLSQVRQLFIEPFAPEDRISQATTAVRDAIKQGGEAGISAADQQALAKVRRVLMGDVGRSGDADAVMEAIKGIRVNGVTAGKVLQEVRDTVGAADFTYKTDFTRLYGAKKAIDDMMAKVKATPGGNAQLRELATVKRSLENQIRKAMPEYGDYLKSYRTASREIDERKLVQAVQDRAAPGKVPGVDGTLKLQPEAMARLMDADQRTVAAATGFRRSRGMADSLSPDRMAGLSAVRDDLVRASQAANLGKPQGSPTAQFLASQNLMRQTLGPLGLPQSWAESGVAQFMGRAPAWVYKFNEPHIQAKLADAILNPESIPALLAKTAPKDRPALAAGLRFLPAAAPRLAMGGMFGGANRGEE